MNGLISIIIAAVLGFLKSLFYSYRDRQLDKKIEEKKNEADKLEKDFNSSYADFKRKLEEHRKRNK